MNIEEDLTSLKEIVAIRKERCHGFIDSDSCLISTKRLETLLTAYEKEKELLELASNMLDNIDYDQIPIAIGELKSELEKEKEKNKELSSQIDEHVYNGCDYELCNKKWLKKIKALMEKEDKLFFETKDVRHANRYKAYKELIEEE